jgi:hypothetical protein
VRWLVDGNNVMGSRPDGWWNDPVGAAGRLTQEIATWCGSAYEPVTVVFDGPHQPSVAILAGGPLVVAFAGRSGRDAADDRIVELAAGGIRSEGIELTVVTADRGLIARLPAGTAVEGPRAFLRRIGA